MCFRDKARSVFSCFSLTEGTLDIIILKFLILVWYMYMCWNEPNRYLRIFAALNPQGIGIQTFCIPEIALTGTTYDAVNVILPLYSWFYLSQFSCGENIYTIQGFAISTYFNNKRGIVTVLPYRSVIKYVTSLNSIWLTLTATLSNTTIYQIRSNCFWGLKEHYFILFYFVFILL